MTYNKLNKPITIISIKIIIFKNNLKPLSCLFQIATTWGRLKRITIYLFSISIKYLSSFILGDLYYLCDQYNSRNYTGVSFWTQGIKVIAYASYLFDEFFLEASDHVKSLTTMRQAYYEKSKLYKK